MIFRVQGKEIEDRLIDYVTTSGDEAIVVYFANQEAANRIQASNIILQGKQAKAIQEWWDTGKNPQPTFEEEQ